ncbi:MAG: hypothetical protein MUC51_07180, partial [Anaerolineae bacterium]|nr:hypothetical protein [Anaerolineae bacterium]
AYPYDEEDKRAALTQGLLAAGLAALGARKGSEFNAFAQAGLLGLGGYNTSLRDATNAREAQALQRMREQQWAMTQQEHALKLKQMQEQEVQRQQDQQALPGLFSGGGPNLSAMGPGGPTPQNAQAVAPKTNEAAQYMAAANYYAKQGRIDKAKEYAAIAKQMEEEFSTSPVTGLDASGNPVFTQFGKRGGMKVAQGVAPPPEMQFLNLGGKTVGVDKLRTAPGTSFAATMAPGEAARLSLDRERFAYDKSKDAAGGADKWVNDLDRGVQINMANGDTRPITSGGQPIGTKKDTKLVDGSQRALTVLDMAEGIIKTGDPTGSLAGNLYDMAAGAFGVSTSGAKSVAGLQALEGALMMAQPRMEGPQSDKDTALYKQMAGKIGDPNVPNGTKLAAVKVIRDMHKKYSANAGAPTSSGATGEWSAVEIK